MLEDCLIVDGYNVLNNWEILKKLREDSFDHARDHLVSIVANYAGLNGIKAVIVFDAHQVKGGVEKQEEVNGVTVIYSKEGESADMVIERIIGQYSKLGIVGVVTSDWVEQQMILGKGGIRLSAREFWHRVRQIEEQTSEIISKCPKTRGSLDQLLGDQVRETLEKWRREK